MEAIGRYQTEMKERSEGQERHTPVWKGQTVLKHVRLSKTEIIEMY